MTNNITITETDERNHITITETDARKNITIKAAHGVHITVDGKPTAMWVENDPEYFVIETDDLEFRLAHRGGYKLQENVDNEAAAAGDIEEKMRELTARLESATAERDKYRERVEDTAKLARQYNRELGIAERSAVFQKEISKTLAEDLTKAQKLIDDLKPRAAIYKSVMAENEKLTRNCERDQKDIHALKNALTHANDENQRLRNQEATYLDRNRRQADTIVDTENKLVAAEYVAKEATATAQHARNKWLLWKDRCYKKALDIPVSEMALEDFMDPDT